MITTLSNVEFGNISSHPFRELLAMALVAKRNVDEPWADAVARLASLKGQTAACLAIFEARISAGYKEYEAAYLALQEFDCLDHVDLPGDPQQPLIDAESDQIEPPGS